MVGERDTQPNPAGPNRKELVEEVAWDKADARENQKVEEACKDKS